MSVEQTLSDRGQRYGVFTGHAHVAQDLKRIVRLHLAATGATMNDTLAGASPVDQPVERPLPKRYEGGRIKGGCSLHDAEKPELCQKALQRCPEPRTVDCCGVVDEHDIVECRRCGKQWTVPCNFDEDYS